MLVSAASCVGTWLERLSRLRPAAAAVSGPATRRHVRRDSTAEVRRWPISISACPRTCPAISSSTPPASTATPAGSLPRRCLPKRPTRPSSGPNPKRPSERRRALRALVSCPTGSIGCQAADDPKSVFDDFPLPVEGPVYYCGFNSPKSYGGNSYFLRHPAGNWLIDSPKFLPRLARRLEALGGSRTSF